MGQIVHKCRAKRPTAEQQRYWDAKLERFGLTVDAGRRNWLDYGHVATDLDYDGRKTYTGERLEEHEEWPISL